MIAMSLSSGVLLASVSLLQLAREDFLHHHQTIMLEDSATYGLQVIARTLQQASRDKPRSSPMLSSTTSPSMQASVQGADNARLGSTGGITIPGVNGSDVLMIQLDSARGQVIDCAGFTVPHDSAAPPEYAWVMFYLAPGPAGEPELFCRYHGQKQWDSQAIVTGVECLQVLFGADTDDDGLPNQFLSASAWTQQQTVEGSALAAHRIVAVHIALVLRSAIGGSKPALWPGTNLFGSAYTQVRGQTDIGTTACPETLSAPLHSRLRRRVDAVIFLPDRALPQ